MWLASSFVFGEVGCGLPRPSYSNIAREIDELTKFVDNPTEGEEVLFDSSEEKSTDSKNKADISFLPGIREQATSTLTRRCKNEQPSMARG